MTDLWVSLNDIPAEGREFSFTDQAVWQDRWKAFGLPLASGKKPLAATGIMQLQSDQAVLVRGELTGSVQLPCDRCAGSFEFDIDIHFDLFEEFGVEQDQAEVEESRMRKQKDGTLELDMGALLWEELILTIPAKPLCANDCKGLCPGCGQDLNTEPCTCDQDDSDPRLAVFRDLKIK